MVGRAFAVGVLGLYCERGCSMKHAWARRALVALAAVSFAGIFAPAQASALVSYYNCVNKPVLEWCDGRANGSFDGLHSWDYNQASNPGGSSLIVCQGVYKPSTGIWLVEETCFWDYISRDYGNQSCACLEANVRHKGPGSRSVNGFADTE